MSDDCDYTPGIPGTDFQNVLKIINNSQPCFSAQGDKVQVLSLSLKSEVPYLPDKRRERTYSLKLNLFIFNVTSTQSVTKSDNGKTNNVSILEFLL